MHSGVYFILNTISLKLYIGSAVCFSRRKSEHFGRLSRNIHHNEHLQRAYDRYGLEAFEFIVIEYVDIPNLFSREEYYIAKHRTTEEEFGYNKSAYGRGLSGKHHSQETKDKISKANKGKTVPQERKDKISASLTGRILSDDRITKMKARRASPETKAKMSASRKARLAINPELVVNAANARWSKDFKITQPPTNAKDYE